MQQEHDHAYKLLFSEPEMITHLLKGFVEGDWVKDLDFTTLERVSESFVSDDLRARHDDMIWRIRVRDSSWLYIYLLLEFQSSSDPHMALRIMVYEGLLYQSLVSQKRSTKGRRLPPVLPLVLYNGKRRWRGRMDVGELVEPFPGLESFVPRCRYLLIDEHRTKADMSEESRNLVAALFALEQSRTPSDVLRVMERLAKWLESPEQRGVRRAFAVFLHRVLLPRTSEGSILSKEADLMEVQTMLSERVKEWTKEWREEGEAIGLAKGVAKGRAEQLVKLLRLRFGSLSPDLEKRIREERDVDTLDTWSSRLFTADSPEDVLR